MSSARRELDSIQRRQARADARFRGEKPEEQAEDVSPEELVLGGALVGLLILALIAAAAAAASAATAAATAATSKKRPPRRK